MTIRLEVRGKGIALLNDDGCPQPFGYLRASGRLTVTAAHDREPHMLALTGDELIALGQLAKQIEADPTRLKNPEYLRQYCATLRRVA